MRFHRDQKACQPSSFWQIFAIFPSFLFALKPRLFLLRLCFLQFVVIMRPGQGRLSLCRAKTVSQSIMCRILIRLGLHCFCGSPPGEIKALWHHWGRQRQQTAEPVRAHWTVRGKAEVPSFGTWPLQNNLHTILSCSCGIHLWSFLFLVYFFNQVLHIRLFVFFGFRPLKEKNYRHGWLFIQCWKKQTSHMNKRSLYIYRLGLNSTVKCLQPSFIWAANSSSRYVSYCKWEQSLIYLDLLFSLLDLDIIFPSVHDWKDCSDDDLHRKYKIMYMTEFFLNRNLTVWRGLRTTVRCRGMLTSSYDNSVGLVSKRALLRFIA